MKIEDGTCLCVTRLLEYKQYLYGNEYQFEHDENENIYGIRNEDGFHHWFTASDLNGWFEIYE